MESNATTSSPSIPSTTSNAASSSSTSSQPIIVRVNQGTMQPSLPAENPFPNPGVLQAPPAFNPILYPYSYQHPYPFPPNVMASQRLHPQTQPTYLQSQLFNARFPNTLNSNNVNNLQHVQTFHNSRENSPNPLARNDDIVSNTQTPVSSSRATDTFNISQRQQVNDIHSRNDTPYNNMLAAYYMEQLRARSGHNLWPYLHNGMFGAQTTNAPGRAPLSSPVPDINAIPPTMTQSSFGNNSLAHTQSPIANTANTSVNNIPLSRSPLPNTFINNPPSINTQLSNIPHTNANNQHPNFDGLGFPHGNNYSTIYQNKLLSPGLHQHIQQQRETPTSPKQRKPRAARGRGRRVASPSVSHQNGVSMLPNRAKPQEVPILPKLDSSEYLGAILSSLPYTYHANLSSVPAITGNHTYIRGSSPTVAGQRTQPYIHGSTQALAPHNNLTWTGGSMQSGLPNEKTSQTSLNKTRDVQRDTMTNDRSTTQPENVDNAFKVTASENTSIQNAQSRKPPEMQGFVQDMTYDQNHINDNVNSSNQFSLHSNDIKKNESSCTRNSLDTDINSNAPEEVTKEGLTIDLSSKSTLSSSSAKQPTAKRCKLTNNSDDTSINVCANNYSQPTTNQHKNQQDVSGPLNQMNKNLNTKQIKGGDQLESILTRLQKKADAEFTSRKQIISNNASHQSSTLESSNSHRQTGNREYTDRQTMTCGMKQISQHDAHGSNIVAASFSFNSQQESTVDEAGSHNSKNEYKDQHCKERHGQLHQAADTEKSSSLSQACRKATDGFDISPKAKNKTRIESEQRSLSGRAQTNKEITKKSGTYIPHRPFLDYDHRSSTDQTGSHKQYEHDTLSDGSSHIASGKAQVQHVLTDLARIQTPLINNESCSNAKNHQTYRENDQFQNLAHSTRENPDYIKYMGEIDTNHIQADEMSNLQIMHSSHHDKEKSNCVYQQCQTSIKHSANDISNSTVQSQQLTLSNIKESSGSSGSSNLQKTTTDVFPQMRNGIFKNPMPIHHKKPVLVSEASCNVSNTNEPNRLFQGETSEFQPPFNVHNENPGPVTPFRGQSSQQWFGDGTQKHHNNEDTFSDCEETSSGGLTDSLNQRYRESVVSEVKDYYDKLTETTRRRSSKLGESQLRRKSSAKRTFDPHLNLMTSHVKHDPQRPTSSHKECEKIDRETDEIKNNQSADKNVSSHRKRKSSESRRRQSSTDKRNSKRRKGIQNQQINEKQSTSNLLSVVEESPCESKPETDKLIRHDNSGLFYCENRKQSERTSCLKQGTADNRYEYMTESSSYKATTKTNQSQTKHTGDQAVMENGKMNRTEYSSTKITQNQGSHQKHANPYLFPHPLNIATHDNQSGIEKKPQHSVISEGPLQGNSSIPYFQKSRTGSIDIELGKKAINKIQNKSQYNQDYKLEPLETVMNKSHPINRARLSQPLKCVVEDNQPTYLHGILRNKQNLLIPFEPIKGMDQSLEPAQDVTALSQSIGTASTKVPPFYVETSVSSSSARVCQQKSGNVFVSSDHNQIRKKFLEKQDMIIPVATIHDQSPPLFQVDLCRESVNHNPNHSATQYLDKIEIEKNETVTVTSVSISNEFRPIEPCINVSSNNRDRKRGMSMEWCQESQNPNTSSRSFQNNRHITTYLESLKNNSFLSYSKATKSKDDRENEDESDSSIPPLIIDEQYASENEDDGGENQRSQIRIQRLDDGSDDIDKCDDTESISGINVGSVIKDSMALLTPEAFEDEMHPSICEIKPQDTKCSTAINNCDKVMDENNTFKSPHGNELVRVKDFKDPKSCNDTEFKGVKSDKTEEARSVENGIPQSVYYEDVSEASSASSTCSVLVKASELGQFRTHPYIYNKNYVGPIPPINTNETRNHPISTCPNTLSYNSDNCNHPHFGNDAVSNFSKTYLPNDHTRHPITIASTIASGTAPSCSTLNPQYSYDKMTVNKNDHNIGNMEQNKEVASMFVEMRSGTDEPILQNNTLTPANSRENASEQVATSFIINDRVGTNAETSSDEIDVLSIDEPEKNVSNVEINKCSSIQGSMQNLEPTGRYHENVNAVHETKTSHESGREATQTLYGNISKESSSYSYNSTKQQTFSTYGTLSPNQDQSTKISQVDDLNRNLKSSYENNAFYTNQKDNYYNGVGAQVNYYTESKTLPLASQISQTTPYSITRNYKGEVVPVEYTQPSPRPVQHDICKTGNILDEDVSQNNCVSSVKGRELGTHKFDTSQIADGGVVVSQVNEENGNKNHYEDKLCFEKDVSSSTKQSIAGLTPTSFDLGRYASSSRTNDGTNNIEFSSNDFNVDKRIIDEQISDKNIKENPNIPVSYINTALERRNSLLSGNNDQHNCKKSNNHKGFVSEYDNNMGNLIGQETKLRVQSYEQNTQANRSHSESIRLASEHEGPSTSGGMINQTMKTSQNEESDQRYFNEAELKSKFSKADLSDLTAIRNISAPLIEKTIRVTRELDSINVSNRNDVNRLVLFETNTFPQLFEGYRNQTKGAIQNIHQSEQTHTLEREISNENLFLKPIENEIRFDHSESLENVRTSELTSKDTCVGETNQENVKHNDELQCNDIQAHQIDDKVNYSQSDSNESLNTTGSQGLYQNQNVGETNQENVKHNDELQCNDIQAHQIDDKVNYSQSDSNESLNTTGSQGLYQNQNKINSEMGAPGIEHNREGQENKVNTNPSLELPIYDENESNRSIRRKKEIPARKQGVQNQADVYCVQSTGIQKHYIQHQQTGSGFLNHRNTHTMGNELSIGKRCTDIVPDHEQKCHIMSNYHFPSKGINTIEIFQHNQKEFDEFESSHDTTPDNELQIRRKPRIGEEGDAMQTIDSDKISSIQKTISHNNSNSSVFISGPQHTSIGQTITENQTHSNNLGSSRSNFTEKQKSKCHILDTNLMDFVKSELTTFQEPQTETQPTQPQPTQPQPTQPQPQPTQPQPIQPQPTQPQPTQPQPTQPQPTQPQPTQPQPTQPQPTQPQPTQPQPTQPQPQPTQPQETNHPSDNGQSDKDQLEFKPQMSEQLPHQIEMAACSHDQLSTERLQHLTGFEHTANTSVTIETGHNYEAEIISSNYDDHLCAKRLQNLTGFEPRANASVTIETNHNYETEMVSNNFERHLAKISPHETMYTQEVVTSFTKNGLDLKENESEATDKNHPNQKSQISVSMEHQTNHNNITDMIFSNNSFSIERPPCNIAYENLSSASFKREKLLGHGNKSEKTCKDPQIETDRVFHSRAHQTNYNETNGIFSSHCNRYTEQPPCETPFTSASVTKNVSVLQENERGASPYSQPNSRNDASLPNQLNHNNETELTSSHTALPVDQPAREIKNETTLNTLLTNIESLSNRNTNQITDKNHIKRIKQVSDSTTCQTYPNHELEYKSSNYAASEERSTCEKQIAETSCTQRTTAKSALQDNESEFTDKTHPEQTNKQFESGHYYHKDVTGDKHIDLAHSFQKSGLTSQLSTNYVVNMQMNGNNTPVLKEELDSNEEQRLGIKLEQENEIVVIKEELIEEPASSKNVNIFHTHNIKEERSCSEITRRNNGNQNVTEINYSEFLSQMSQERETNPTAGEQVNNESHDSKKRQTKISNFFRPLKIQKTTGYKANEAEKVFKNTDDFSSNVNELTTKNGHILSQNDTTPTDIPTNEEDSLPDLYPEHICLESEVKGRVHSEESPKCVQNQHTSRILQDDSLDPKSLPRPSQCVTKNSGTQSEIRSGKDQQEPKRIFKRNKSDRTGSLIIKERQISTHGGKVQKDEHLPTRKFQRHKSNSIPIDKTGNEDFRVKQEKRVKLDVPLSRGKKMLLKAQESSKNLSPNITVDRIPFPSHTSKESNTTEKQERKTEPLSSRKTPRRIDLTKVDMQRFVDSGENPVSKIFKSINIGRGSFSCGAYSVLKAENVDDPYKPQYKQMSSCAISEQRTALLRGVSPPPLQRLNMENANLSYTQQLQNATRKKSKREKVTNCEVCGKIFMGSLNEHIVGDRHIEKTSNQELYKSVDSIIITINKAGGLSFVQSSYNKPKTNESCSQFLENRKENVGCKQTTEQHVSEPLKQKRHPILREPRLNLLKTSHLFKDIVMEDHSNNTESRRVSEPPQSPLQIFSNSSDEINTDDSIEFKLSQCCIADTRSPEYINNDSTQNDPSEQRVKRQRSDDSRESNSAKRLKVKATPESIDKFLISLNVTLQKVFPNENFDSDDNLTINRKIKEGAKSSKRQQKAQKDSQKKSPETIMEGTKLETESEESTSQPSEKNSKSEAIDTSQPSEKNSKSEAIVQDASVDDIKQDSESATDQSQASIGENYTVGTKSELNGSSRQLCASHNQLERLKHGNECGGNERPSSPDISRLQKAENLPELSPFKQSEDGADYDYRFALSPPKLFAS